MLTTQNRLISFYISFMVTTKQKPVLNTQKIIRNLNTPLKKDIKTHRKRAQEEKRNINTKQSEKINKMIIRKHLSIINLHISGLYFPVKRQTKG